MELETHMVVTMVKSPSGYSSSYLAGMSEKIIQLDETIVVNE
jgi:hypothetical protein